jgi:hypothetical protein
VGLGVSAAALESSGAGATSDAAIDSLRFLADNTGGTATLAASDRGGLAARLQIEGTPYYLVRYRSSNTKLDGRFRALSARTTRPDVGPCAPRLSRPHPRRAAERPRGAARARPRGVGRAVAFGPAVVPDQDRGLGQHRRRLVLGGGGAGSSPAA